MRLILLSLLFCLSYCFSYAQAPKEGLNTKHMRRAQLYVSSSQVDSLAFGGFGGSDNAPKAIANKFSDQQGLFLLIAPTPLASTELSYATYHFYIGNKRDSSIVLTASDSRLSVVAEVYYEGKWQAIEYLPSSWCGNSYHRVYLASNHYWSFLVPKFTGSITTQLRYTLQLRQGQFIYSNAIPVSFNKGQLSQKKEYPSNDLMDPYDD